MEEKIGSTQPNTTGRSNVSQWRVIQRVQDNAQGIEEDDQFDEVLPTDEQYDKMYKRSVHQYMDRRRELEQKIQQLKQQKANEQLQPKRTKTDL